MALHVAIVLSGEEIRDVLADSCREGLTRQLAGYVRERAVHQLWPADGVRVRHLLAAGCPAEAVSLYFTRSGERWDREQLVVRRLDVPVGPATGGT